MTDYPHEPGARANSTGETAHAAARAMKAQAQTLSSHVLGALAAYGPQTPEQVHARIEKQLGRKVLLTSVRPRFSSLKALGYIVPTEARGLGEGGRCKSIVWALAPRRAAEGGAS